MKGLSPHRLKYSKNKDILNNLNDNLEILDKDKFDTYGNYVDKSKRNNHNNSKDKRNNEKSFINSKSKGKNPINKKLGKRNNKNLNININNESKRISHVEEKEFENKTFFSTELNFMGKKKSLPPK